AMESVLTSLPNLQIREQIRDDDFADQMHHYITVYLFAFFGVMIGLKEYWGTPLDCWVTAQNWQHFQGHANSYCWAHKLFHYPQKHDLSQMPYELSTVHGGPLNATEAQSNTVGEINFYRWITVVFIAQALMFKLPNIIWQGANEYSGTQIEKMVTMISDSSFKSHDEKEAIFSNVAEYIETWLKINRKPFWFMKSRIGRQTKKILEHCMLCVGANTGNYLSSMYLVVKALFLINVFLQFAILTAFLEFNFWPYGPQALEIYSETETTVDHVHFPRVALCHFQVKGTGSWIQCLLTINMLLEKIFIVEWFWMLILIIATSFSMISWLWKVLSTDKSIKFVTKYLSVFNADGSTPQEGRRTVPKFVRDYLGNDGIFLLRILATNTNDVVMAGMVCSLWLRYVSYENKVVEHPYKVTSEPSNDLELEVLKPAETEGSDPRDAGAGDGADVDKGKNPGKDDPGISFS
ncbi:hypothetical protein EGW08_022284, partial [Elysia chlorotica]